MAYRPHPLLPPPQVYDTKGRFVVHRISKEEASYKLCKVRNMKESKGGVPVIMTHDGRTIRYPDPEVKVSRAAHWGWDGKRLAALLLPASIPKRHQQAPEHVQLRVQGAVGCDHVPPVDAPVACDAAGHIAV